MKSPNQSKFVQIEITVTPHASVDKIEGWKSGRLRIKIRGVPEKGKVNQRLIEFLANELKIAKSNISIVSGTTSRLKRIRIEGLSEDELNHHPAFFRSF